MSKVVTMKFQIDGMHCTSCAMHIDFDLEDMDGVKTAKTHYAKQVSEVVFDEEKVSPQDICKVIEKTGYTAQVKKM